MIDFDSLAQATMTTGASPIKDCPRAALASFFLVSLFLTMTNFHSWRLLEEGESLAPSSTLFSLSSSTAVSLYALTLLLWLMAVKTSIFFPPILGNTNIKKTKFSLSLHLSIFLNFVATCRSNCQFIFSHRNFSCHNLQRRSLMRNLKSYHSILMESIFSTHSHSLIIN